jgi:DNA-binding MarR family transcriptional regulator/GNAT superfamily N-acetyltransferase
MTRSDITHQAEEVRRFNRFYTRQIGLLQEGLLHSPFSLTESRVLYELAQSDSTIAANLRSELGLDAGYLSRILAKFNKRGLIEKSPSKTDARQSLIRLTGPGREAFSLLNSSSQQEIKDMLAGIDQDGRERLLECMHTIQQILTPPAPHPGASVHPPAYLLRTHQPGDMGWIVHRHGIIYAREYGWDETFEALVADIVAGFIRNLDEQRERCWIAEMDRQVVGSVFLVRLTYETAKLRLLYVEPEARGLGIGSRLVSECIQFARRSGYRKIILWTNSVLLAARKIYASAGFRVIETEAHHSFGKDLVSETWELEL